MISEKAIGNNRSNQVIEKHDSQFSIIQLSTSNGHGHGHGHGVLKIPKKKQVLLLIQHKKWNKIAILSQRLHAHNNELYQTIIGFQKIILANHGTNAGLQAIRHQNNYLKDYNNTVGQVNELLKIINTCLLNEILPLYREMINNIDKSSFYISDEFPTSDIQDSTSKNIIHRYIITLPLDKIKETYEKYGIIVLRPHNGETTLTIGQGNYRLSDAGGYIINLMTQDNFYFNNPHANFKQCTLDPDLRKNPTVVAYFGSQDITKVLPHQFFMEIKNESIGFKNTSKYPFLISSLKTLTHPSGKQVGFPTI